MARPDQRVGTEDRMAGREGDVGVAYIVCDRVASR